MLYNYTLPAYYGRSVYPAMLGKVGLTGFKRNYWVIVSTWVLVVFGSRIAMTYMSNYVYVLGGDERLVGYVLGVAAIPTALVRIIGGAYSDVHGRKKIIVKYTWILAITSYLIAFAPDWRILLIAMLINSVTLLYTPALQATLAESMPPGKRTLGFLYANIIPELLSIPAPLIGGFITSLYGVNDVTGYRIVFTINAVLLTIVAIIRHVFLEETIKPLKIPGAKLMDGIKGVYNLMLVMPRWLKKYLFLNYVVLSIPVMMYTYYGIRYVVHRGYNNILYGLIVTIGITISMTITVYVAKKQISVKDTRPLGIIVLMMSLGIALFALDGIPWIVIGGVLAQSGIVMRFAIGNALLHEYISDRLRARFSSFALASLDISSLVAGLVSGTLYPISPFYTMILASILCLPVGIVFLVKPIKPPLASMTKEIGKK